MARTAGECVLLACLAAFVFAQVAGGPGAGGALPFHCGPVCAIYCPYGNVRDAKGCPTCRCNQAPVCATCRLDCPSGTELGPLNERGCPLCSCVPIGCNDRCTKFCQTGINRPSADCRCTCRRRGGQPVSLASQGSDA